MKATIDSAGRLVIPKVLRDRLGLSQGEVEVEADGADLRVRLRGATELQQRGGWLVVPASGALVSDEGVRAVRDADQR
jgi:AbrB family looped-hinge helix DNA binding protein